MPTPNHTGAEVPAPAGLAYRPFQLAGIRFALERTGTLIADEMGLGKTVQALGLINAVASIRDVLIVCPASLRINWERECLRWLVRAHGVGIATSSKVPYTDVVIVNYDILAKLGDQLQKRWDLLVLDEAHYLKNPQAKRSQAARAIGNLARRKLLLTGTPIMNRPVELHGLLQMIDADAWPFWPFAHRYCGARRTEYGWDFTGARNLGELQRKLRSSCMVRRLKSEVLTELPAKQRQVVTLPANGSAAQVRQEMSAWERVESRRVELAAAVERAKEQGSDSEWRGAMQDLKTHQAAAFEDMAALRQQAALAKVPALRDYALQVLESEDRLVLWCHHHEVMDQLEAALAESVHVRRIDGRMGAAARQESVDWFQGAGDGKRVLIAGIRAAGVGLTLTAARVALFAELDWTPSAMSQAEDRLHRIGQRDPVLVQHVVLDGSMDALLARAIIRKQAVADAGLNAAAPADGVDALLDEAAARSSTGCESPAAGPDGTDSMLETVQENVMTEDKKHRSTEERIASVMAEVRPIVKDAEFGYKYASADAVHEALRPLLAKHGLSVRCSVTDWQEREVKTKSGPATWAMAKLEMQFDAPEGATEPEIRVQGGFMRNAQGYGALTTYAVKYWLRSRLLLTTGEDDLDATNDPAPAPRAAVKLATAKQLEQLRTMRDSEFGGKLTAPNGESFLSFANRYLENGTPLSKVAFGKLEQAFQEAEGGYQLLKRAAALDGLDSTLADGLEAVLGADTFCLGDHERLLADAKNATIAAAKAGTQG